MKAIIAATALITIIILSGCLDSEKTYYKGIPTAEIPEECIQYKEDICPLFDCMTANCWCDKGQPSPVLKEGSTVIVDEEGATTAVLEFVLNSGSEYTNVRNVAQISSVFYNVFAINEQGEEKVFTVAADGTIITTQCGV